MSDYHGAKWNQVLDSLPTECSRNHETVEMINYSRANQDSGARQNSRRSGLILKFFCPSCHQKIKVGARKISDQRYAATSIDIIEEGNLSNK